MAKYIAPVMCDDINAADPVMSGREFEDSTIAAIRTLGREFGVDVVFAGQGAFTTGKLVCLPALDHTKELTRQQYSVAQGFASHEAMHNLCTDFSHWASGLERLGAGKQLIGALANAIEDVRIESVAARLFPGMPAQIAATVDYVCKQFLTTHYKKDPSIVKDLRAIGPLAITWIGRRDIGCPSPYLKKCIDTLPAEIVKKVETFSKAIATLPMGLDKNNQFDRDKCKTGTAAAIELAKLFAGKIEADPMASGQGTGVANPNTTKPCTEDGKGGKSDPSKKSKKSTPSKPDPSSQQGDADDAAEDDAAADADEDAPGEGSGGDHGADEDDKDDEDGDASGGDDDSVDSDDEDDGAGQVPQDGSDGAGGSSSNSGGGKVPEVIDPELNQHVDNMLKPAMQKPDGFYHTPTTAIDILIDRHSKPLKGVNPYANKREGTGRYLDLEREINGKVSVMRRKLERALKAEADDDRVSGQRIGRLDVGRRAAAILNGAENVRSRKVGGKDLDTAVYLLLDASGSMGGNKFMVALQSCIALIKTLEPLGVETELMSYTTSSGSIVESWKSHDVIDVAVQAFSKRQASVSRSCGLLNVILKSADERLSQARHAIGMATSGAKNNTPEVESIQLLANRLLKSKCKRKILIVATDGQPGCGAASHIEAAATKALKYRLSAKGVQLYGIMIGGSEADQYGDDLVKIDSVDELARTAIGVLARKLLNPRQAARLQYVKAAGAT